MHDDHVALSAEAAKMVHEEEALLEGVRAALSAAHAVRVKTSARDGLRSLPELRELRDEAMAASEEDFFLRSCTSSAFGKSSSNGPPNHRFRT